MKQIKSKQRVANYGEVFTNEREVNAMLDLVWGNFLTHDKQLNATYLEPACGSGNFLVAILTRKLQLIRKEYVKTQDLYQEATLRAVCSLYGIELLPDNATECRERLLRSVEESYLPRYRNTPEYAQLMESLRYVLEKNIVCGDALKFRTQDQKPIIFTEWSFTPNQRVQQRSFDYEAVLNKNIGKQLALFSDLGEPVALTEYTKELPIVPYLQLYKTRLANSE